MTTTRARWIPLAAGTLVLALLALYIHAKLEVRNDITDFLPDSADKRASLLSRELADSELARTMILSIEGPDGPSSTMGYNRAPRKGSSR